MVYAEMLRTDIPTLSNSIISIMINLETLYPFGEMGERMIAAARTSGIKITLVPVFYQKGNFGTEPLPHQRRFISASVEDYFSLLEASRRVLKNNEHARLGFSVHSLRAVELEDVIKTFQQGRKNCRFISMLRTAERS